MMKNIFQCLLLSAGIVFCVSEKSFSQTGNDTATVLKKFSFGLYNFNYLRDYEYFSPIEEGYTLCGAIVNPTLQYNASKHVSFIGGVLLQNNFGDDSLRVRPTFLLKLENKTTEFNFGNYRNEGYDLIEPLYFADNLVTENIDNGFLMRQYFRHITIIQWLDWERAIKKGSDFQEQVWGGATVNIRPLRKYFKALQFPLQAYVQHTGGQINIPDTSFYVKTILNAAAGIKSESYENPKLFSQVGAEAYYAWYKNFSPSFSDEFNNGNGIWASAYLRLHLDYNQKNLNSLKFILSYWQGTDFISPKGNPLMQSISSVYPESDYTEPKRNLLLLALKYENEIDKKLELELSFEPYYDLNNKLLEYGIHLQTKFPINSSKYWRLHWDSRF